MSRRNILLISTAVFVLAAALAVHALDGAGFRSGQTVGSEVYLKGFGGNARQTASASFTMLAEDDFVTCTSDGSVTVALLPVAEMKGKIYGIAKGTGGGTSTVTVNPSGSEKIDGQVTTASIDAVGDSITIYCDGTEWIVTGRNIH